MTIQKIKQLIERSEEVRDFAEHLLANGIREDKYVVEVGAYTYNPNLMERLECTMAPYVTDLDEANEIAMVESFSAKVQGRYRPVYAKVIKAKDWYECKATTAKQTIEALNKFMKVLTNK